MLNPSFMYPQRWILAASAAFSSQMHLVLLCFNCAHEVFQVSDAKNLLLTACPSNRLMEVVPQLKYLYVNPKEHK